ncbi:MAG TPA: T9SS type A sorting domain-containing protein, partial [Flavitalea sp.]|nr:T9SS type A sorting domain-containing protein [Flavitalea sp.]
QYFFSDTAVISARLTTGVGFNCTDSFSFHWNKNPAITSYTVYRLGDKYLEPLQSTIDTSIILKKVDNASTHYAVAANIQGKAGVKSYAFNYNTQGIGCYIKSFLVDLANANVGKILLALGTVYNVNKVAIEKLTRSGFVFFRPVSNASVLNFNFTDTALLKGGNSYRARIDLANGQTIYSQVETIYYLPGMNYLVFPNPARTNFQLVSTDNDNTELVLYNATGQKVLIKKITSPVQDIPIHQLNRGVYFVVILQKNKKVYHGSLLVQ